MKCSNCDAEGLQDVQVPVTRFGITKEMPGTRCPACEEQLHTFSAFKAFEDFVVAELEAGRGENTPESRYFVSRIRQYRKKRDEM